MGSILVRIDSTEAALLQSALIKELRQSPEQAVAIDTLLTKLRLLEWPYIGCDAQGGGEIGHLAISIRLEQNENK